MAIPPILVADFFPEVTRRLVELMRSLSARFKRSIPPRVLRQLLGPSAGFRRGGPENHRPGAEPPCLNARDATRSAQFAGALRLPRPVQV